MGKGTQGLTSREVDTALDYIRNDKNIWEVIITGGDPFVLSPRRIFDILKKLEDISHVQILRIHTRVPIATPERMTDVYVSALRLSKPLYVSVHVNHVNEITPEVETALRRLHDAGCTLLAQTVLLKRVNDTPEALETLFRKLVRLRVRPYYLHHCDLAPGTSHFQVSLAEGQSIVRALRGKISGLCQPHYVLDIPGGYGKVNAAPCSVHKDNPSKWTATDRFGQVHNYPDI